MSTFKHPLVIRYRCAALASALGLSLFSSGQAQAQWLCESSEDGQSSQCQSGPNTRQSTSAENKSRKKPGNLAGRQTSKVGARKTPPKSALLDWVRNKQLTPEQQSLASGYCKGVYIDPLANVDKSIDPKDTDIETLAGNSELQGEQISLSGGVEIKQSYRHLKSNTAQVNKTTRIVVLEGNVELREPGVLLLSDRAEINTDSGQAQLDNSRFVLHEQHLSGGAPSINRNEDGLVTLENGHFTYCPPADNTWELDANKIELDRDSGVGTARQARLKIKDIPVFYAPVISFPIDDRRKSGFLWPEVGSASDGGFDIAAPYYFNLAENYDATLVPRHIGDRGAMTEAEARYLGKQAGYWAVGGSFLSDDDLYPDEDGDRWLSRIEQHGLIRNRWRTNIDYTRVSDKDYFGDLGTTSLEVRRQTHLRQIGEVDYLGEDWLMQLRLQQFQTIAKDLNDEYKKLPQLSINRRRIQTPFELGYILGAEYTHFDHDTKITGQRMFSQAGVSFPMRWAAGFITPTVKYKQLSYKLDDPFGLALDENPDEGAAVFSLDSGLYFERETSWNGWNYQQTLEPRVFYLYSGGKDQNDLPAFDTSELTFSYNQLFRESRFSGHDRIDDANQLAVGLTTRFIDSKSGRETLSASLGQIFYFEDREVRPNPLTGIIEDSSSAIAAELAYRPGDKLSLSTSVLWDTQDDKVEDGSLQISYATDNSAIYNLIYNFDRGNPLGANKLDIEQLDISTYFPLTQHWRVFLRARYGLGSKEIIEDALGFEYQDCCWSIRIMHARSIDPLDNQFAFAIDTERDHATYIEFQLKGLGGIGNRMGNILKEMIWGYKESEH